MVMATAPYLMSAVTAPEDINDVWTLMCTFFGWIFMGIMFVAVVYIVIAAYTYITANGDPKKVDKANHMLLYAVIGVVVAVLARNIPKIAASIVGKEFNVDLLQGTEGYKPLCL